MTTVFSYIDGEYALADDTPDVTIEDTVYEIAGKYFDDLDEDVQQEILRFKFNIQAFEDVTDDVIEEIFFRLNNSTPLTKPQKAKPLMGVGNSIFINEILENRFFKEKCNFTKRQLTQSADLCTLLQGMMLLDNRYRDYDFPNISDDEAMVYSKWINGNYPDECRCKVKKIVAFLDNIFYQKEKNLRKINIPILFLMADKALSLSISGTNFRRWFYDFFEKHKEEYGQYCSSGSIKKEKTLGRIEVMERYFDEYFRTDDEEITEQKGEVKSIHAEITESAEQEIADTEKESEQEHPDTEQADNGDDKSTDEQDNNNSASEESDTQDSPESKTSGESDAQENADDESDGNNSTDNQEPSVVNEESSSDNADSKSDGSDDTDTESSSVSEDADSEISTPISDEQNSI